jgi:hypothetical protein
LPAAIENHPLRALKIVSESYNNLGQQLTNDPFYDVTARHFQVHRFYQPRPDPVVPSEHRKAAFQKTP